MEKTPFLSAIFLSTFVPARKKQKLSMVETKHDISDKDYFYLMLIKKTFRS